MQLFLDSYGAFLGVRNGQFFVRTGANRTEHLFAVREVDVIFITRGTTHTADALILALENDTPVIFIDGIGHPIGQVWSGKFGSISTIRRNQIQFAVHTEGWLWLARHLRQKIDNQNWILHQFSIYFKDDKNAVRRFERTRPTIQHLSNQFDRWQPSPNATYDAIAPTFRAWEATASRHYFRFLASVAPPQYAFENRNYHPALDKFNCLLNYLYGMLYAYCELALMKSGIDPAIGILHVDRYNRPTMVYDFIEAYRVYADYVALDLVFKNALPDDAFSELPEYLRKEDTADSAGVWLARSGKSVVVNAFLQYLEEKIPYKKNTQKRHVVLDLEAQQLASVLKKFNS